MREKEIPERISLETFSVFWEAVVVPRNPREKNLNKDEIWEKIKVLPLTEAVEFLFSLENRLKEEEKNS